MNAGLLAKILECIDPKTEVTFSIGEKQEYNYREECAKVEIQGGECLNYLNADKVEFEADADGETTYATVILKQSNWTWPGFRLRVEEYDKTHKKED